MEGNRRKKRLAIGASCLAAGILAATLTGMAPGGMGGGGAPGIEDTQSSQSTVVEVTTPSIGTIAVTGSYAGTVEPGQQVTVYPKVSGEVLSVYFNVGDMVEAGDVLFTIDSTSLQYSIAQTQATISSKQAQAQLNLEIAQQDLENYQSNVAEGYNSSILQAEAAVQSADNALQQANNNYRSARQTYNDYINGDTDGDYSDSQRDSLRNAKVQAELQVESAQLQLESAKATLEATKKQVEDQQLSAQNSVKSAQLSTDLSSDYISLQQLQSTLGDYTVTSPITGVVEQRNIDPYDMASGASAAFVISNKDLAVVSFNVTESTLSHMKAGDSVTIEKNGETCTGIISELASMTNSSSGLYAVKVTVENAPFELRSGSSVKLHAQTQKVENEMMIPIDAVYYDNGAPYVYVFENNTALKVEIETGILDDDHVQVVSGLSLSDRIIVTWSSSLYNGAEVYLPGTAPGQSGEESGLENSGGENGGRENTPDLAAEDEKSYGEAGDPPSDDTEEIAP